MTKKQKGVTNWPNHEHNALQANGKSGYAHIDDDTEILSVKMGAKIFTKNGHFWEDEDIARLDITHLNKKLTPAGIAHKEAGWPYGVPGKGFEQ